MEEYTCYYKSPLGVLAITGTADGVSTIRYVHHFCPGELITSEFGRRFRADKLDLLPSPVYTCLVELDRYFAGELKEFSVKILPAGTEFQKKVWRAVQEIPYGCTVSYEEIARMIENPKATRAVGNANHRNKLPLLIPCHRVIGKNRRLTGYNGGLWRKEWLLAHEKTHKDRN